MRIQWIVLAGLLVLGASRDSFAGGRVQSPRLPDLANAGANANADAQIIEVITCGVAVASTGGYGALITHPDCLAIELALLRAVLATREPPRVGRFQLLLDSNANARHDGAHVIAVTSGGAAARAGLVPGDRIVSVNGVPTPTEATFLATRATHRPGETVAIVYVRGSTLRQTRVRLDQ